MVASLAFILATLEKLKLQLDIQSKSNFAHKVEPKLNIVRLLLLFRVYGWEVLIMLTREPANKDHRAFSIHLV